MPDTPTSRFTDKERAVLQAQTRDLTRAIEDNVLAGRRPDPTDVDIEVVTELLEAAARVAAYPPAKPGKYVYAALVPWTRIRRLRAALEASGVDWREWRR